MQIQSTINNIRQIVKSKPMTAPSFRTTATDGCKVHTNMPVKYKSGKAILSSIYVEETLGYEPTIFTKIKNFLGKTMGEYHYTINPKTKTITKGYIETDPKYRNKGVGEIMRLSSIMELKENHISAIELDALPEAIQFHSKYKFEPNLKKKESTVAILESISELPKLDKESKTKAKELIAQIHHNKPPYTEELNTNDEKAVNGFMTEYIETHKNNWQDANFHQLLPMKLTSERVQKNSDFFNKLFQKHGIDYVV